MKTKIFKMSFLVMLISPIICAQNSFAYLIHESENVDYAVSGEVSSLTYFDTVHDNGLEDTFVEDARILIENEVKFKKENISINIDAEARSKSFVGFRDESDQTVELKDAYVELRRDGYSVAVGNQTVTWGKMDDYTILDLVNPQDLRDFIMYEKQERKEPQPMVRLDFQGEGWAVETVYIPTFESSDVEFFGSDWAVFGKLQESVNGGNFTANQKNIVNGVSIQERDSITDNSWDNGQVAIRLKSKMNDVDYSLYYFNQYHSVPVLREKNSNGNILKQFLYNPTLANLTAYEALTPTGDDLILEEYHPRTNIVGADWETVMGEYGVRGEVGYFFDLPYLRDDFSYVEKDTVTLGLGVDHTTAFDVYWNLQFITNHIFSYEALYVQEKYWQVLTGTISKDFLRGDLSLVLDWAWQLSYEDFMLNPEVVYRFGKGLQASVGAYLFEGKSPATLFGRYDAKDVAYIKFSFAF